jgi:hypothetical protein
MRREAAISPFHLHQKSEPKVPMPIFLILVNDIIAELAPKLISTQCQADGQIVKEIKPHILETAQRMLDRFGDEASREVELRAFELRECGEMTAAAFWQKVHDALLELCRGDSDQTKH